MLWEKDKEKEYLIGKMEVNIKANFSKIRQKVKVYMNGLTVENMKVTEKIIKLTGKENSFGLMEKYIQENTLMIISKDSVFVIGQMEDNIRDSG